MSARSAALLLATLPTAATVALTSGCDDGAPVRPDAGRDAHAGDASAFDAALDRGPADAGGDAPRARACTDADPAPCPPPGHATWPMPSPPALPLPNPARYEVGADSSVDLVTGLEWQHAFTEKRTWEAARAHCAQVRLGGHADWRLPSRIELVSLVDHTRMPTIDPRAFPAGTPDDYFWSSSTVRLPDPPDAGAEPVPDMAYSVYFGGGLTAYGVKTGASAHARCVRGGGPGVLPRWTIEGDTVLDRNTGLRWERRPPDLTLVWDSARRYCAELSLAGSTGWRLPLAKELQTVVDEAFAAPVVDPAVFPDTPPARTWTASGRLALSSATYLDMRDGQTEEASLVDALHVRCVR